MTGEVERYRERKRGRLKNRCDGVFFAGELNCVKKGSYDVKHADDIAEYKIRRWERRRARKDAEEKYIDMNAR